MKKVNSPKKMSPQMSNVSVRDTRPFTGKINRVNQKKQPVERVATSTEPVPEISPKKVNTSPKNNSGVNNSDIIITLG